MTNTNILQELEGALNGIASVAANVANKISVIAVLGLIVSTYISWLLYSNESSLAWNITKCGLTLLPAIIICLIWRVLSNFANAPRELSVLSNEEGGFIDKLQSVNSTKSKGLGKLISTVRIIRNDESLSSVAETLSGLALLTNPFFLLLAFVSLAILLLLILIAPFVLMF